MNLDDLRKTIEAAVSNLTPSRAQELARGMLDPGAAKDQVARTAADLLEWSHKSRERISEIVRREIQAQGRGVGMATQADLDALRKRVRDLERAAGLTGSGRAKGAATSSRAKATAAERATTSKRSSSSAKRSSSSAGGSPSKRGGSGRGSSATS